MFGSLKCEQPESSNIKTKEVWVAAVLALDVLNQATGLVCPSIAHNYIAMVTNFYLVKHMEF